MGAGDAATRSEEARIRVDQLRRNEAVEQKPLCADVEVTEDEIEESRSLDEPPLQGPPFGGRQDEGDEVEVPGAIRSHGVAVHVVGDAMFSDDSVPLVATG